MLSVSAPPSFAQHWLMPRLPAFDAGDAEVAIEASQSLTQPEWQADRVRLAIRFGPEPCAGTGVRVIRLMGDSLFPVCAPSLLEKAPGLTEPADLAAQTLLHVSWPSGYADGRFPGWRTWLDSAGASSVSLRVRQRYSLFTLALDQAIAGHGVALASRAVVADRLASGVLVAPFGERYALASPFDYWLLLPDDAELPALAARFRDWLIAEADVFATRRQTVQDNGLHGRGWG